MSQLQISNSRYGTRKLNVLSFNSPVAGQMASAQTRSMVQYFPIKAFQPELELEVVFRNENEYQDFQRFVRNTQVDAQNSSAPGIRLYWPERSIYNWTGVIKNFRAGGQRRNFAPKARFVIDLVDSMVSSRSTTFSVASSWEEIYGINTPGGVLGTVGAVVESLIALPSLVTQNFTVGGRLG